MTAAGAQVVEKGGPVAPRAMDGSMGMGAGLSLRQGLEQQGDVVVGVGRDGVARLGPDVADVLGDVLHRGPDTLAGVPTGRLADEDPGELAAPDREDLVGQLAG